MPNAGVLKKQVLFEDIEDEELERLSKLVTEMKFKKDSVLFSEGDDTKGLYFVKSGKVRISKVTADGWMQSLAVIEAGHFFGELSILEQRKHEASAVAVEDAEILLLSKEDFERIEKEENRLAVEVLKKLTIVLSKNLRRMNDRFMSALINY